MMLKQMRSSIQLLLKVGSVATLLCISLSPNAIAAEARTFTTWNISGATLTNPFSNTRESKESVLMKTMNDSNSDVMCLNEAGKPTDLFADDNHPWTVQYRATFSDPVGVKVYEIHESNQLWGWLVWREDQADGHAGSEYGPTTKQSDMILIRNSVADSKWNNISPTQSPHVQTAVIQNGKRRALLVQNANTVYGCYHANPGSSNKLDRTVETIDYRNKVAQYAADLGSGDNWIAMGDMNITPRDLEDNEVTAGPLWGALGRPSQSVISVGDTYKQILDSNTGNLASPRTRALDWFMANDRGDILRKNLAVSAVLETKMEHRRLSFDLLRGYEWVTVYQSPSDHAPASVFFQPQTHDELRRR